MRVSDLNESSTIGESGTAEQGESVLQNKAISVRILVSISRVGRSRGDNVVRMLYMGKKLSPECLLVQVAGVINEFSGIASKSSNGDARISTDDMLPVSVIFGHGLLEDCTPDATILGQSSEESGELSINLSERKPVIHKDCVRHTKSVQCHTIDTVW